MVVDGHVKRHHAWAIFQKARRIYARVRVLEHAAPGSSVHDVVNLDKAVGLDQHRQRVPHRCHGGV